MRYTLLALLFALTATAQKLPILKLDGYVPYEYSVAEGKTWEKIVAEYKYGMYDRLEDAAKVMVDSIEMGYGPLTQGPGCSWYCGGGPYKITASSYLESADSLYVPDNAQDFNVLTPWVPAGNPIGAKLNFHFEPLSPRVHTVQVYNGYLKNLDLWKKNARAKKLKLYINGKAKAILALDDVPGAQSFRIDPVRSETEGKDMVLTLEVLEVYKGSKYNDLAIAEVNFDGLDVHCFAAGTRILMADGTETNIEGLKPGDSIAGYDPQTGQLKASTIDRLVITRHANLAQLRFGDRDITVTDDHPFWADGKGWVSINPEKSNKNYEQEIPVAKLEAGDRLFLPAENRYITLEGIEKVPGTKLTYTPQLENGSNFIANGILVKTEELKPEE